MVDASKQHLDKSELRRQIGSLEGLRLVCHCRADEVPCGRAHRQVRGDFPGLLRLAQGRASTPGKGGTSCSGRTARTGAGRGALGRGLSHRVSGMGLVRGSPFGSARLREAGTFVKEEACARQAVGVPTHAGFLPLLCDPPSLNLSGSWPYGSAPSTRSRRCGSARWCSPQSSFPR